MVNKREQEIKEHENLEVKKYWLALKTCYYICVCVCVKITPHIFMGSHVAAFSFSRFSLIQSDSWKTKNHDGNTTFLLLSFLISLLETIHQTLGLACDGFHRNDSHSPSPSFSQLLPFFIFFVPSWWDPPQVAQELRCFDVNCWFLSFWRFEVE